MSCSSVKMGSNRCTAMASSSTILYGMILRLSEKAICNGARRGFGSMAYEDSSVLRPCLNVEIESVHRICLMTDSVDRSYFGSKRPY